MSVISRLEDEELKEIVGSKVEALDVYVGKSQMPVYWKDKTYFLIRGRYEDVEFEVFENSASRIACSCFYCGIEPRMWNEFISLMDALTFITDRYPNVPVNVYVDYYDLPLYVSDTEGVLAWLICEKAIETLGQLFDQLFASGIVQGETIFINGEENSNR